MINKTLIFFMLIVLFILPSLGETLIYDNITTSNYKYITMSDNLNIAYLNEYTYDVDMNGYFLGSFHKGDRIFYPDNSTINIHFKAPITTDISTNLWNTTLKPVMLLLFGFLSFWGLLALIILYLLYKAYRTFKRG